MIDAGFSKRAQPLSAHVKPSKAKSTNWSNDMTIIKSFVFFLAFAFAATLVGCTGVVSVPQPDEPAQAVEQTVDEQEEIQVNKETVRSFLSALNSNDPDTARSLMSDYIQHNPFIPTGPDAILSLFPVIQENETQVNTVRLIQDGNYVVAHNFWENAAPFGAEEVVTFDVFRIDEDGLLAEHWDALMPNTPPNPSGRTLTDGATEITDLDQTEANKAIVAQIFDVIINGTPEEVGAVVTENFLPDYKQHSPTVADGIPAVFEAFGVEEWVYQVNHKILGEGNFVLSISEGTAKGVHSVFYDLLRFENGKVAEHWDVIQAIPTEGLANDNGMFGFE
jgi:predicted SnoaL-like aldol condensation-catalyzing enzyme